MGQGWSVMIFRNRISTIEEQPVGSGSPRRGVVFSDRNIFADINRLRKCAGCVRQLSRVVARRRREIARNCRGES